MIIYRILQIQIYFRLSSNIAVYSFRFLASLQVSRSHLKDIPYIAYVERDIYQLLSFRPKADQLIFSDNKILKFCLYKNKNSKTNNNIDTFSD